MPPKKILPVSNQKNHQYTTAQLKVTDFIVLRKSNNRHIIKIVSPHDFQVGLDQSGFDSSLNVIGDITGSIISANTGFSGSLTQLTDGTSYLIAGSNITITTGSSGAVTIATSTATGTTTNALTISDGLQLNSGTTFDGSAAVTLSADLKSSGGLKIDSGELAIEPADFAGAGLTDDGSDNLAIDISGQTLVSATTSDHVLILDATDGALKKATVATIQAAGATLDIAGLSNTLTESTLATGDLLAVADINASNEVKKITIEDVGQYLASATNSGIGESSGKLKIDANDLATSSNINVAADSIIFVDADDNVSYKDSIADLITGVAGTVTATGLASSSGTLALDITNQTSVGTLSNSDEIIIYDVDASALKKTTIADVQSASAAPTTAQYVVLATDSTLANERVLTAGDGLDLADGGSGSSATLTVDVTDLIDTSYGLTESSNNIRLNLKSSSGLKFDSGELSIEPNDFAGTGLQDDGSDNLEVIYGTSSTSAAKGSNTVTVNAGDGLSGGGTMTVGNASDSVTLNIKPSDFAGAGTSIFNSNISTYIAAGANVTITTGSDNQFVIAAQATNGSTTIGTMSSFTLAADSGTNQTIEDTNTITLSGGTGIKSAASATDTITINIDDSVVATLSGSLFSGPVIAPKLSGSLQSLSDGTAYILAGNNITITTGSTGAITIAANVAGGGSLGTITQVNAGTGLSGGGSSGTVTLNVDIDSLTGISSIAHGDLFALADVDDSNAVKKMSISNLSAFQAGFSSSSGYGIASFNGRLYLKPNDLQTADAVDPAADVLIIEDADDSSTVAKKTGISDLITAVKGTGLKATNGVLSADDSIVATLTGSTFSGIVKAPALSGSLTHLSDGSSYLIAGSNITITTGSSGAITISSTGAGLGIGAAEDGSYADGLFTDFVSSTPTGTAIDRINEVLKALAPTPAPDLDDLDCDTSDGVTAFLSFGTSNDQSSQSPAYISSATAAGFSAIDVNESYAATTSGNNIRKGIYNGSQVISGDLNEDVSQNNNGSEVNFVANSFGNGDIGTLKLEVNGSVVHSIELTGSLAGNGVPGSGDKSQLNANSSGFINLSQTGSAVLSNGDDFPSFQHRTGKYQIGTADQRNGWNYARVIHTVGSSDKTTNYVEWVNDNNSDALSTAGNSIEFDGSGSIHLSGVEYFTSGTIEYKSRVNNAYKYIYDTNNITFTIGNSASSQSGLSFSLPAQSKPTINTGAGETHTKKLHLTSSATITANYFLSGTITTGVNVTHPIKSDLSNNGQRTISPVLMYNLSNSSTALVETFRRENYRIISGSYDTQNSVTASANIWDSNVYMTASNGGHSDGLQFFNEKLLSPINTINSGNFSLFANGPAQNPDYSSETGTRTFIRWFKNETGSSQTDLSLAINGSSTIVSDGTSLTSSRITVLIKFPGTTGWMDLALPYVLDSISDSSGAHIDNAVLDFDNSLNATNYVNFGNVAIPNNHYVILKVLADESWTGNISQISVDFGAGTGTLTAIPDLDDIDSDNTGTSANLSFGSAKSISGYSNPTTSAGFTAADLNDLYEVSTNSNNLRRAVFDGSQTMEGDLNEDVTSPGNDFVANAFSDANSGSLKLEVNGAVIHTLEITGSQSLVGTGVPGSGTATSLNGDGSGFISLSQWGPGLFDNGVPKFSEIQRTARYRITAASQRSGWNYARVIHTVGGSDRETNYVEWVNDANANALSSSSGLSIFGDDSFSYISGVKYFTSPSGSIELTVDHIYKNVYSDSASAISFTSLSNATASRIIQSGSGLSSTKTTSSTTDSLQTLSTSTDSQNETLHVTGTINFTQSKSLPGTYTTAHGCAGAMVFAHPLKSPHTSATQSTTNLLVWTPSDTSDANTDEQFTGESYRLVSGSYSAQSDVSGGSKNWNSQRSMNDQGNYPEHATGLLIYDTYLIPPKDGGSSGNFQNHTEGGGIESPAGNVNYSSAGLTNSVRDYFRSFLNNTTNDRPSVNITIYGDATIVGRTGTNAGTLGANKNIFVEVGIPGKTGLLDLGRPSAGSGNFTERDGCLSGDLDATVDGSGATNTCTFNGRTVDGTVSGAEYLVIRISASKSWTGYLDRINVSWS